MRANQRSCFSFLWPSSWAVLMPMPATMPMVSAMPTLSTTPYCGWLSSHAVQMKATYCIGMNA